MKLFTTNTLRRGLMALALTCVCQGVFAASVMQQNLVDLIEESDTIVVGTVSKVTDGFTDKGVPFTEVTLKVSDNILGAKGDTYTFRQFGLTQSREVNGLTYLGTTPDGWPNWIESERVVVFLNAPARLTGLQTTVGLNQGKLRWADGRLANSENNVGLFKNMSVNANDLSKDQQAMLKGEGKAVAAQPFVSLVRRAVDESWIAKGVMRHAN
jgi:hypothetical protein